MFRDEKPKFWYQKITFQMTNQNLPKALIFWYQNLGFCGILQKYIVVKALGTSEKEDIFHV